MSELSTDPSVWTYGGEGGKHAVFCHRGRNEDWNGKLLRLSKAVLRGESSGETEIKHSQLYIKHVVAPYLQEFVDVPRTFSVEQDFVKQLYDATLRSKRVPKARLKSWERSGDIQDEKTDILEYYSMITVDYRRHNASLSTNTSTTSSSYYTLEVKPKAGYLAFSPLVHPSYRHVKYRQSRFRSLQVLTEMGLWNKGWKGENENNHDVSLYEPLDLFSSDCTRIHQAVQHLFQTPQNNLRVYENHLQHQQDNAQQFYQVPTSDAPTFLQGALVQVLASERGQDLLQRIQAWQKNLDVLDVDGACIVYERLVELVKDQNDNEKASAEQEACHLIDDLAMEDLKATTNTNDDQDNSGTHANLPGLEASPFRYKLNDGDKDCTNSDNTPMHTFCRKIQECRQMLEQTKGTLPRSPTGALFLQETRQQLLDIIQNELTVSDCIFLLRNWLLSLMMCDISIFVALQEADNETDDYVVMVEADGESDHDIITVHKAASHTIKHFRCSLHVIDCDPKPAKKLHGRAEKEQVFAKLR